MASLNTNIGAPLTGPSPMVQVGMNSLSVKGNAQSKGGSTTIPKTTRPQGEPSPMENATIQTNDSHTMAMPEGLYLLGNRDQGGRVIGGG